MTRTTHTGLWDRIVVAFRRAGPETAEFTPSQMAETLGEKVKRISDAMRQMADQQMLSRCEITTFNSRRTGNPERWLYRLISLRPRPAVQPLKRALQGRPIVGRGR